MLLAKLGGLVVGGKAFMAGLGLLPVPREGGLLWAGDGLDAGIDLTVGEGEGFPEGM